MKKPIKEKGIKYWLWYTFGADWKTVWLGNTKAYYRNNITGFTQTGIPAKMVLKIDTERKLYDFYITDHTNKQDLDIFLFLSENPSLRMAFEPYKNYKNVNTW